MNYDGKERRSVNQEYQEIMKRLLELDISNATILQEVRSNQKASKESECEFRKMLERINHTVYGNGNEGHATRIDRLEIAEKHRYWSFKVIWTSLIGLLMKVVYDLFQQKGA